MKRYWRDGTVSVLARLLLLSVVCPAALAVIAAAICELIAERRGERTRKSESP